MQYVLSQDPEGQQKQTEHRPHRQGAPRQILYVDIVGPFEVKANGDRLVLTMQDGFKKFVCEHPIRNKEATVVVDQLMDSWIIKFGCPSTICSN